MRKHAITAVLSFLALTACEIRPVNYSRELAGLGDGPRIEDVEVMAAEAYMAHFRAGETQESTFPQDLVLDAILDQGTIRDRYQSTGGTCSPPEHDASFRCYRRVTIDRISYNAHLRFRPVDGRVVVVEYGANFARSL